MHVEVFATAILKGRVVCVRYKHNSNVSACVIFRSVTLFIKGAQIHACNFSYLLPRSDAMYDPC